ncbi:E3 ubiquitin-protein ligase DCST1-like [Spea bombifrons]|uniref:E3 ubiquitin-protein ligase DCST1-like n=1 Tax=Spea bombifrons TaxID=233779 RepID=UPI00234A0C00|nr:E3 ubiquitin-protein ligase DCST1-like [Spea bombifrons]
MWKNVNMEEEEIEEKEVEEEEIEGDEFEREMTQKSGSKPMRRRSSRRLFKRKRPNSTIKRFLTFAMPMFCLRFLFSDLNEFFMTKFFLGAGAGGMIGTGIYFLLVHPMNLYQENKINLLYGISGTFAIGWGTSSHFRCATIMMAPNILGKEGRAYLLMYVLESIFDGPVSNLQHNMEDVAKSIGCTVELQINHTKLSWKVIINPFRKIIEDLVKGAKELKNDTSGIKSVFKETDSEVQSSEGYDKKLEEQKEKETKEENKTLDTLQKFNLKSMLRCEFVIEKGIEKCREWFAKKHDDCMKAIPLPVLNHLLCLPMQFKFLCNIMNVVNTWCKKKIPMEANFGTIYDKVNATMNGMDDGFASKIAIVKQEQSMFLGMNVSKKEITEEITETLEQKKLGMRKVGSFVRVVISCTFVFIFISAYKYCHQYNTNIRFDNAYVTTYFRQIDARRRKRNKRHLLPLRKGERKSFVFPWNPAVQDLEMKTTMMEFFQCVPMLTFLILALTTDWILYHLFQIIRKHSHISYVFSSHHKLEVLVGGDTFISKILRRTIGNLNSSSATMHLSNNTMCLLNPIRMSVEGYLWSCLPVVGLLSLCFVQVYIGRLRRVIAAFFFPKREKRRVLFLYNEHLKKRAAYAEIKRKQIIRRARANRLGLKSFASTLHRYLSWMRPFIRRRCIVCSSRETKDSYVCEIADCGTVYCRQCWRDMKRFCYACTPHEDSVSDSESDEDELE